MRINVRCHKRELKVLKKIHITAHIPNGEGTMLPVDFDAPYLYKYEAAIIYSMLAFTPKSLSVALIIAISSFAPDFLLTPAKYV
jgi:hypothetical protein